MEASLGGQLHPGIDRVPTDLILSGDLGNLTAGPGFLNDGEFGLRCGMIIRHHSIYGIIKRGVCQEKSVG